MAHTDLRNTVNHTENLTTGIRILNSYNTLKRLLHYVAHQPKIPSRLDSKSAQHKFPFFLNQKGTKNLEPTTISNDKNCAGQDTQIQTIFHIIPDFILNSNFPRETFFLILATSPSFFSFLWPPYLFPGFQLQGRGHFAALSSPEKSHLIKKASENKIRKWEGRELRKKADRRVRE